jgi:hypothetical protein
MPDMQLLGDRDFLERRLRRAFELDNSNLILQVHRAVIDHAWGN